MTFHIIGCTVGSTDVNQQLKEIKDPNSSFDKMKTKNPAVWMQAKKRLDVDEVVFKVYKGVKCFNFSKGKNVLVTGGMILILIISVLSIRIAFEYFLNMGKYR